MGKKPNTFSGLEETFDTEVTLPSVEIEGEEVEDGIEVYTTSANEEKIKYKLQDSAYLRKTLKTTIKKSQKMLDDFIAETSDGPSSRNIEVAAKLVEAIAKATDRLTALNAKEKDIEIKIRGGKSSEETSPQINNNLILTTEELISQVLKKQDAIKP